MWITLLAALQVACGTYSKPIASYVDMDANGLQYLHEAGYLTFHKQTQRLDNQAMIVSALMKFQEYAGLPKTGRLDEVTKEYMKRPRCGIPDVDDDRVRRRRYTQQGTNWRKANLTWALENSNDDGIPDVDVRRLFKAAFDKWQSQTHLNFEELVDEPEDSADIRVRFAKGKHQDCPVAFDGKGGTLAHGFYPLDNRGISGDVHLDDQEHFISHGRAAAEQYKLLMIATHEIGHSLGLAHSNKKGAIMYAIYQDYQGNDFQLTFDDIRGIQSIYGVKTVPTEAVQTTESGGKATPLSNCTNVMRAVYMGDNRKLHVINNNRLYVLYESKQGIEEGPISIRKKFPSLTKVDTVFRRHTDQYIVLFHDDRFTVYDNNNNLIDKSRNINDGFQNIHEQLTNIDAAFIWPLNNKLYIFKGEKYWRMSQLSSLDYRADFGYPLNIAAKWHGLPGKIDSAFKWTNNKIYFTKGEYYWRWNENKLETSYGYPIKLSRSFLSCPTDQIVGSINAGTPTNAATLTTNNIISIYIVIVICYFNCYLLF